MGGRGAGLTGALVSTSSFGIEGFGALGVFSTCGFLISSSDGRVSVIALRFCADVLLNF